MMAQETRGQLIPVTVLFVDISGSTALYAERGDTAAFGLTIDCLELVTAQITAAGGRVLRQIGDGVLAVFDTPAAALHASIRIIEAVDDPARSLAREGVRVRSGISSGSAVLFDDDVYGDVANVAARLVGRAGAGEIFLSDTAYTALPPELQGTVQLIDELLLRNRPAPVPVYKYVASTPLATIRTPGRRHAADATMEIAHGGGLVVIGPDHPHCSLGRDATNDVRVDGDVVSRHHAEIALRGDRFVLSDHSTNGTYVYPDDGPMLRVLREELVLTGGGGIILGAEESSTPIRYKVSTS